MSVGHALIGAGTLLQVQAQRAAGKAAQQAANYNADVNERNAKAAEIQAETTERLNRIKEVQDRDRFKELNDRTQMQYRGQGWAATTGTPLKRMMLNALRFEQDLEIQSYNTRVKALQSRENATNARLQAEITRFEGRAARKIAHQEAYGTLLSGASQMYFLGK